MATGTEFRGLGRPRRHAVAAAAALSALGPAAAWADTVRLEPQVTFNATALKAKVGQAESYNAIVGSITPSLHVQVKTARVHARGNVGVEAAASNVGDGQRTVRPRGSLDVRVVPVANLMQVDMSGVAEATGGSVYDARPDTPAITDDPTLYRYKVRPQLQYMLSSDVTAILRTEYVWNHVAAAKGPDAPTSRSRAREELFRLERSPEPTGWALEVQHEAGRLSGQGENTVETTTMRGIASFVVTDQLLLGASVGREHVQYSPVDRTDTTFGLRARWVPSERSQVKLEVEKRFFGTGIEVEAKHRTPFLGFGLRAHRKPLIQAGALRLDPNMMGVESILDGVLTTRTPDAASRQKAVQDFADGLGLQGPSRIQYGPYELNATYAQLHSGVSATALVMNRTSIISLTGFAQRQERLQDADSNSAAVGIGSDVQQVGVQVQASTRLSPLNTLDASLRVSRVRGLGAEAANWSHERSAMLGLTRNMWGRNAVFFGLRHQQLDSNVAQSLKQTSLSATLTQQF